MRKTLIVTPLVLTLASTVASAESLPARWQTVAKEVLRDSVNVNTAAGGEGTTRLAERLAARLRSAGFDANDIRLAGPDAKNKNLVVRLRGTGQGKAILLIAHMDTVTARSADWSTDPFTFTEKGDWWYGRGIVDDKAGVATLVTNLLRWKEDRFVPARDVIVLLTTAEETDAKAGMEWMVGNARDLIDAEYALNTDAGSGLLVNGRPQLLELQAAEKVYQTYRLEVTNPGGHSSLPRKDNAIYQLATALEKIAAFQFPVQLTDVSREYFARSGRIHQGQLGADMRAIAEHPDDAEAAGRLSQSPLYNSMLRTTCVATRLEAGHADNALPQRADATVNCRILPGVEPSSVRDALARAIADPAVTITSTYDAQPSPPSPLRPEITGVIEQLVREQWKVPTVPTMETGATDGLYLRNAGIPTYGVGALFEDPNDVRSHGRDERIDPRWFFQAVAFWDRMVRELAGGAAGATSTGR